MTAADVLRCDLRYAAHFALLHTTDLDNDARVGLANEIGDRLLARVLKECRQAVADDSLDKLTAMYEALGWA